MIQNLNAVTFRPFGTILSDTSAITQDPLAMTPEPNVLYRTAVPTCLSGEGGSWVLSICTGHTEFQDYYLDKTVRLNAGILFSLTALQTSAPIQLSAPVQMAETSLPQRDFHVRPNLQIQSLYTFFYQEKELGFLFPGEAHPMAELTYVDQGTLHSVADGQDLVLQQGDMVLYAPNQWHMQYADVDVAPRFVTVSFDAGSYDLSSLHNRVFHSPRSAIDLLVQMLRERDNPDSYSQDLILSLLTQLLLTLLRQGNSASDRIQSPHCVSNENHIVQKALRYISDHVYASLSVPKVAQNTGVSPSYLTALFHKHLQQSPGEYIRRIKLQQSKQMLREGKYNITEIAQLLHYSTVHHFSRQFKEKFGITPSQYAKSVK